MTARKSVDEVGDDYIQKSKDDWWLCRCGSYHKGFPYKCPIRIMRQQVLEELLILIEKERDEGNMVCGGFSAALCLSNLIKHIKEELKKFGLDNKTLYEKGNVKIQHLKKQKVR